MHHVELLLDPESEQRVRADWDQLAAAGLPSLRSHRSPSNRPHVTVTMVSSWPAEPMSTLPGLDALPLPVQLGPLTCFGTGPWVLVRAVVVTEALLRLHGEVVSRLGPPASRFCTVDRWVPHVSLGSGLDAGQLGRAVELLSPSPPVDAVLDRARHWDSVARVAEPME